MKKNLLHISIILLVVIALVFGYLIYQQSVSDVTRISRDNLITPTPPVTKTQTPPPVDEVPEPAEVPVERLSTPPVLMFPEEPATVEERQRHYDLVAGQATDVSLLEIEKCAPDPTVLRVDYEESVAIRNSDTNAHTLSHGDPAQGDERTLTILAGETKDVVVSEFVGLDDDTAGLAGYQCDGGSAGIFFIIDINS